eukprot:2331302-Amphidinium_carterae.1
MLGPCFIRLVLNCLLTAIAKMCQPIGSEACHHIHVCVCAHLPPVACEKCVTNPLSARCIAEEFVPHGVASVPGVEAFKYVFLLS